MVWMVTVVYLGILIEWVRNTHARLVREQGGVKRGLAFMHIPPQEFMYAWEVVVCGKDHL